MSFDSIFHLATSLHIRAFHDYHLWNQHRSQQKIVQCIAFSASPLAGWNVTLENKTSNSLQLRWMDINHRLNGSVHFFVVTSKSSHSSFPVRKILSPHVTSAEITELDPNTVYNVSVVAIDGYGSPFQSTFLQARTDEGCK